MTGSGLGSTEIDARLAAGDVRVQFLCTSDVFRAFEKLLEEELARIEAILPRGQSGGDEEPVEWVQQRLESSGVSWLVLDHVEHQAAQRVGGADDEIAETGLGP